MVAKFGKHYPALVVKNERERLFFLASAGLLVSLVILVLFFLNFREKVDAEPGELVSPVSVAAATVALLASDRLVQAGTDLSGLKFKEVYWPKNLVPDDAILDVSEVRGQYAKSDILADEPIRRVWMTKEKAQISLPVTPGNRAVSIELGETEGVVGHTLPGTRVDVILTYFKDSRPTSEVIVQNAKVLSLNGDASPNAERAPRGVRSSLKTVTLDVSQEDSLKIITAKQIGKLSLSMRAGGDSTPSEFIEMPAPKVLGEVEKKDDQKAHCTSGKMRMAGKEYLVKCDGSVVEIVTDEP